MTARWDAVANAGSGWAQVADVALAQGWLDALVTRTGADAFAAGDATTDYAAQRRLVLDALGAAAGFVRALNLPPLSVPQYRLVLRHWYGTLSNADAGDAAHQRVNRARGNGTEATAGARIAQAWTMMGREGFTALRPLCGIVVRAALVQPTATPLEDCLGTRQGDGDCSFDGPETGCAQFLAPTEGCDPWGWLSWAWYTPHIWVDEGLQACRIARALPPLRWSLELLRDFALLCSARGACGVLDDSRLFVAAANARTAAAAGRLPAELQAAAARVPLDLEEALINNPDTHRDAAVLGVAAAGLATAGGPPGLVGAAVLTGLGAVIGVLPTALGFEADQYGRAIPVWERSSIATSATGTPTYDVADPPDFDRAHYAATCAAPARSLLRSGVLLHVRPPGAVLAPAIGGGGESPAPAAPAPAPARSYAAPVAVGLGLLGLAYLATH